MAPLIAGLLKAVLPVFVQQAAEKIAEKPATKALARFTRGSVRSRTMWAAVAFAVLGYIEANLELITQTIGAGKMGYVLIAAGVITAILRAVTSGPVSKK